jgi:hypothetical protein
LFGGLRSRGSILILRVGVGKQVSLGGKEGREVRPTWANLLSMCRWVRDTAGCFTPISS